MAGLPDIHERFRRHTPPRWVRPTVERLLESLPAGHLGAIQAIVLTDAATIGRGKTHRVGRRKYLRNECLGFYHPASRRQGAWIELVVDNIVPRDSSRVLLWFQLFRDWYVSKTLYHEIGHHLDATVGSATRGGEAAAEDWRRRLSRIHARRHYRHLKPLLRGLRLIVRLLRFVAKKCGA
ncbi:MAG TPA: hypothetical protein VE010_06610 [Thermoanaerobaculia bacterium]|nr:hypothetical protein [Thermoanaerobaculia bacterium]